MKKYASVLYSGMALVLLEMVLTACGGSSSSDGGAAAATAAVVNCSSVSPSQTISVVEYSFSPSAATVAANGVIKWTNNGAMTHSVTSGTSGAPDGMIDSNLPVGQSVCLQFTTAGGFSYYCKYHPTQMSGSVTVQ